MRSLAAPTGKKLLLEFCNAIVAFERLLSFYFKSEKPVSGGTKTLSSSKLKLSSTFECYFGKSNNYLPHSND